MKKIRATIVVDPELWKEFKKAAIDEGKSYSDSLAELLSAKVSKVLKAAKVEEKAAAAEEKAEKKADEKEAKEEKKGNTAA